MTLKLKRALSYFVKPVILSFIMVAGCTGPAKETLKTTIKQKEQVPKISPAKETIKPEKPTMTAPPVPSIEQPEAATLALKFTPQDLTTYKVTIQAERSVKFEGPLQNKASFKGGCTGDKIEITFTQQIKNVNEEGSAIAEITIKQLKYLAKIKDKLVLDFDSTKEKDPNNPLAKLIGQSYTIEITPWGEVSKIINTSSARAQVEGKAPNSKAALRLLSSEAIKKRHTIPALTEGIIKQPLSKGDSYSKIETLSFGMMGSKSYEKIYTLKEINSIDNHQLALLEMNAIPESTQSDSSFSKMFDNIETYTGQLKLDLTTGKVEECLEKLRLEWVVMEPQANQQEEPNVLRMTATRLYHLEKID